MKKIAQKLIFEAMKSKKTIVFVSFLLLMVVSCDEPETVVTNIIHPDGSITRKIEMRNNENKFKLSDLQVPFDNSWSVKDSTEIDEKGDTTWVKRVEKTFKNVDELNLTYLSDSGANKMITRKAAFLKKFKWFNTEYRFTERIDKKLEYGYPLSDFLNSEELHYFFSPDNFKIEKATGPDSLKYKTLSDSIKMKTDKWTMKNLVSEWIGEFSKLAKGKVDGELSLASLKSREDVFVKICESNEDKLDSLWSNGILLKQFIGEANALKYKNEADSALDLASNKFWINFKEYSVRIVMPGNLTGTNGFIDSSQVLLWPVKSDFFMTQPYQMWAESKIPNIWAWIVSGIFLVFVLTGVIIKVTKKG
jgi:hypothetical protein